MTVSLSRRRFLSAGALGLTALPLAGCDVLDGVARPGNPVRDVLEGANTLTWRVQRLLGGGSSMAPEFSESEIRQTMRPNGVTRPPDAGYEALRLNDFRDWRLEIGGLVERPLSVSREQLTAMPARTQITRHDCVEGWSCIAKWTGVPLRALLDEAGVKPQARFAMFSCMDTIERGLGGDVRYSSSIDLVDARHPQTILAYAMNGSLLPVENGAPLRLRVERQLGYKMPKYLSRIELVDSFASIGLGRGGYWEDRGYDWYAGI